MISPAIRTIQARSWRAIKGPPGIGTATIVSQGAVPAMRSRDQRGSATKAASGFGSSGRSRRREPCT
jgi:hypothetical protein